MITPLREQRLKELVTAFLIENKKLNLSAFRTEEHCWIGNVLDSISFLSIAETVLGRNWEEQPVRLLDLGTGGGFPLLPLSIVLPNAKCVGVDAVQKKVDAVQRIVTGMNLKNVELICQRSERLAQAPEFRGMYDVVTARAVAPISVLLEYMIPFLKVHGRCVLWKSKHIADELRMSTSATKELRAKLIESYTYDLPGDWGQRTLLVFEKVAPTPNEYPREVGVPKHKPLGAPEEV
jgi:16S rRNA (guanine527-N7)-methyltransferase